MKYIDKISTIINIAEIYVSLLIKTFLYIIIIWIIEKIGIKLLRKTSDNKKEYQYTQKFKLIMRLLRLFIIILLWGRYIREVFY